MAKHERRQAIRCFARTGMLSRLQGAIHNIASRELFVPEKPEAVSCRRVGCRDCNCSGGCRSRSIINSSTAYEYPAAENRQIELALEFRSPGQGLCFYDQHCELPRDRISRCCFPGSSSGRVLSLEDLSWSCGAAHCTRSLMAVHWRPHMAAADDDDDTDDDCNDCHHGNGLRVMSHMNKQRSCNLSHLSHIQILLLSGRRSGPPACKPSCLSFGLATCHTS